MKLWRGREPHVQLLQQKGMTQTQVNIDYHIELRGHYYSAPYALIHEQVDGRLTATTVPRSGIRQPKPRGSPLGPRFSFVTSDRD
jgi:hypothetical protein